MSNGVRGRLTVWIGAASVAAAVTSSGAMAFDPSPLPQTCKDTLGTMQADKARFAQLGKLMTQYRKASDNKNFCEAAKQIVEIIKAQNASLDGCIGELGGATTVPQGTADQMIQLGSVYRQMLQAAKDPKNDRLHCGLSDL